MHEPFKMVAVNIVFSILLIVGLFIYRYLYPQKKINLFILLLLISLLPLISLLRPGDYESGDFNIRIYHIISFFESLKEGNFFPSWAGELNATYGNPLFIFNYSLPYYGVSFFHAIGFSFISSMKIFLGLTLYCSGITMYLWIKKITNNSLAAFMAGVFYVFSPYHLVDVHFRATLGESAIFALAPLCFYFVSKYLLDKKYIHLILISACVGLLFLAHPVMAIVFLPIIVLYSLLYNLKNKNYKLFIYICFSVALGIIASAYTWLGFIIYKPYMFNLPTIHQQLSFLPFSLLFYSPWRYGFLFQGPHGELSFPMGYAQIIVLIISIYMLFKNKIPRKDSYKYLFWVLVTLFFIFMMHPFSIVLWERIDRRFSDMLVEMARLPLFISLCLSVVSGYFGLHFLKTRKGKILIYFLIFVAIMSTILNWGHRKVIPEINDEVLKKGVWKSTYQNDGVAAYFINNKWADANNFWFSQLPSSPIEIIEGKGEFRQIFRSSTVHKYLLNAQAPVIIKENTLFFPGWKLQSNNNDIKTYPGKRGITYARLPSGLQYLTFTYDDFLPYKIVRSIGISLFMIMFIIIFAYYTKLHFLKRK